MSGEKKPDGGVDSPEEYRARYGTEIDTDSVARLCREHGLRFPSG